MWRQSGPDGSGKFAQYDVKDVSEHMSFLEMLDDLNEELIEDSKDPIAFDHDCREGICGACSMVINGHPHGPKERSTACQIHMRHIFDAGMDEMEAAKDIALANYEDWMDAERVYANVASIYREIREVPAGEGMTPMEVFAGMAELFKHQKSNGTHGHQP